MTAEQLSLFQTAEDLTRFRRSKYGRTQHGGVKTKGHRKLERPLSDKKWIHLVLKSTKAKGPLSFRSPKHQSWIESLLYERAQRFGVRIHRFANVGNHLHLQIRIVDRYLFGQFLRSVTSQIARKVTGANRSHPFGRFWQGLAFTRVLTSGLEELNLRGYIRANQIEGLESYSSRESFLKSFNRWVYRERRETKFLPTVFSSA